MENAASPNLQQVLSAQNAPESHLRRIALLMELCASSPGCVALCLVGSYAKGCGDRISDLDLVVFTRKGADRQFLDQAHEVLAREAMLDHHAGTWGERGSFRRYIFLDFASCELHAFSLPTDFKLRRPYLPVWDPTGFLPGCEAEGEPIKPEEFEPFQCGDDGLVWELLDCIKWLRRGRVALTKDYLRKLAAKF